MILIRSLIFSGACHAINLYEVSALLCWVIHASLLSFYVPSYPYLLLMKIYFPLLP